MISFKYGAESQQLDVTEIANAAFVNASVFCVAKKTNFNQLFGDPYPNKEKLLTATFEDGVQVTFPEQRQKNYQIIMMRTIPKTIAQFWNPSSVGEEKPDWVIHNTAVLKYHHPDFDLKVFTYTEALEFIRKNFDCHVFAAFRKCAIPAMQSDFFRCCYLYIAGGFYFDLKTVCHRPFLYEYIDIQEDMVIMTRNHELLLNRFIGAHPSAEGLRLAISEMVDNILNEKFKELFVTTGAPILTKQCQKAYGSKYEKVKTLFYGENCPIDFCGLNYKSEHWSIAEKKQSIYSNIDLKLLLQVDHIFVLNLDSRTDRLAECVEEFKKLGLTQSWERFAAYRGANADVQARYPQAYAKFSDTLAKHGKIYVDGAFGCLVSHYEMIKLASERGYKRVLILEDDFEITDLLLDAKLLQTIGCMKFDMFYLSSAHMEEPTPTTIFGIKRAKKVYQTAAYIVDQSAYKAILNGCFEYARQIDVFYADVIQKNMDVLCTDRCAVIQRAGYSDIIQRHIKYVFQ